MKNLTLMRHAKSSWKHANLPDLERPLNKRGKRAVAIIGKHLARQPFRTEAIFCSPAVRSLSTGRGIGKVLDIAKKNIRIIPEIYGADGDALFSVVKNTDHALNDIILVGHEPALSGLLEILTGSLPDKFPTCAVYRIRFDVEEWKNIKPKKGMCEFYVNPKLLEEKES